MTFMFTNECGYMLIANSHIYLDDPARMVGGKIESRNPYCVGIYPYGIVIPPFGIYNVQTLNLPVVFKPIRPADELETTIPAEPMEQQ